MFIATLNYVRPIEEIDKLLPDHVEYLKRRYAAGDFVASGRKVPRTGGVILGKAKSRAAFEALLAEDPFQQAGVAEYEVVEFTASMTAPGFEALKGL